MSYTSLFHHIPSEQVGSFIMNDIQSFHNHISSNNDDTTNTIDDTNTTTTNNTNDTTNITSIQAFHHYIQHYLINTHILPHSTQVSSPMMLGHMTSSLPWFHIPLSRLIVTLNQNMVKQETSATLSHLEQSTVALVHQAFYASSSHGTGLVCSGGTIANITGLWIARNKALPPKNDFKGVEQEGLVAAMQYYGYKRAVIVGSRMMHYSIKKAVALMGLGEQGVIEIETDDAFCTRMDVLRDTVQQLHKDKVLIVALVGIAGTTESGSIDPLYDMALLCQEYGIHFHVDAAWGGPMIYSQSKKHVLKGIEYADTLTVDGHKQLYTPMGLGLLLLKQAHDAVYIQKTAHYIIRSDSDDSGKTTLEGSRPCHILYLHAVLHLVGPVGLDHLISRSCQLTLDTYYYLLHHPHFIPLHEPMSNILLFCFTRYKSKNAILSTVLPFMSHTSIQSMNHMNDLVQQHHLLNTRECISRTRVLVQSQWIHCLRMVISNPLVEQCHIQEVLSRLDELGQQLWSI